MHTGREAMQKRGHKRKKREKVKEKKRLNRWSYGRLECEKIRRAESEEREGDNCAWKIWMRTLEYKSRPPNGKS